jgi:DNA-directed RNA polymerase specialized sigma24 family protein
MAWDGVEFRDREGNLVPEKAREVLLKLIEKGLSVPDADPDKLISAAHGVSANIGSIKNLAAYANRSIFRAARKSYVAEKKLVQHSEPITDEVGAIEESTTSPESIERQILIQQMLEILSGQERDIYELRLKGYSFADIDEELNLKPRTSEYRFREAQLLLRRMLPPRP